MSKEAKRIRKLNRIKRKIYKDVLLAFHRSALKGDLETVLRSYPSLSGGLDIDEEATNVLGNLKAEMARRDIKINDIVSCTGLCRNSVRSKLQGKSAFSIHAALKIQNKFFPDIPIEELFKRDSGAKEYPPA